MTTLPPAPPTGLAAVDALLQPFNRSDAPGLVVGIARAGETVYRRGVGMACIEQGVAMSPTTRVRIASTSKHFTALAVLLLAEDGRLRLDDPVHRHLPELPVLHEAGPTLRQLMQHTGGWRTDLASVAQGLAVVPKADWTAPIRDTPRTLNFAPGSRMIYSNAGYQLLARVIERVAGQRFEDFMRDRVFVPLGMPDTESVTSDLDVRPGMALQYQALPPAAGGGLQRGIYPGELRGSGSLVSTIDDMLRWLAHLRSPSKRVGSADSWAQMLAWPTLSTGVRLPYALGLLRHDHRGVEVIHHAGAVLGATSQMITVPGRALDVMIMANGASVSTVGLGFQIIDALLGDALGPPAARVPAAGHAAVLGTRYHAAETGAVVGFEDVGGQLALGWFGSRGVPLRLDGDAALLACEDVALNPVAIALGQLGGEAPPDTITVVDGGHVLRCRRLPETPPSAAALASALTGRYHAPDLGADARLVFERSEAGTGTGTGTGTGNGNGNGEGDGTGRGPVQMAQLVLQVQGQHGRAAYRLVPLSDDVLQATPLDPLFAAIGGSAIVNVDREGDRVTGLRLDAPRLRDLRFVRQASDAPTP